MIRSAKIGEGQGAKEIEKIGLEITLTKIAQQLGAGNASEKVYSAANLEIRFSRRKEEDKYSEMVKATSEGVIVFEATWTRFAGVPDIVLDHKFPTYVKGPWITQLKPLKVRANAIAEEKIAKMEKDNPSKGGKVRSLG